MNKHDYYFDVLYMHYSTAESLLDAVAKDEYHLMWYSCRDHARRILLRDAGWELTASRIDDFVLETTRYMIKRLPLWRWKAGFEIGALHKHLSNVKDTILWIIKRWVSILKNLFDSRYKNHIQTSYLVVLNEAQLGDTHNA